MLLLLGTEYCKIDSNGRFRFPIAIKKQMETEDSRFVVRRSIDASCLELWTYERFQEEVQRLQEVLNPYNKEDRKILRKLTQANMVELDSSDRLLIPAEQKGCLHEAKEIVLQSTGKYIEIWDKATYEALDEETEDWASLVDSRLGKESKQGNESE